jgi:predicted acylesterase/phospholipase RssA
MNPDTRYCWLSDQALPLPVQQEELRNIALRRALQQQPGETQQQPREVADSLTGLALSGGGIRSATFGLGVLEALKEQDRLRSIDYLSTVSGGGYIGAWLSANCRRVAACA